MKSLIVIFMVLVFFTIPQLFSYDNLTLQEQKIVRFGDTTCQNYRETDIPTIFIPGILASWYSEEGYGQSRVKRWIPDPITHVYDPLFFTFKRAGYTIEDVFYDDEFTLRIEGNPKGALYLFGYDWKHDNKITATLLTQLIGRILEEYERQNGCNIGKVNIIAHSMGGLVARAMLEDMCVQYIITPQGEFDISGYNGRKDQGKEDNYISNGKINDFSLISCKNPFPSDSISSNIRVHNLITIATPHRGSPKALPIWEHGDIEMTDGWMLGGALKWQATWSLNLTDDYFYRLIHGYEEKIPNGMVTIGQLLPDVEKNRDYNEKLRYVSKNGYKLSPENYPKNSFLEDLNTTENINKIWNKVDNFVLYYSTITGNKDANNIVSFSLDTSSTEVSGGGTVKNDISDTIDGKDIYDAYLGIVRFNRYNISSVYRNETGIGGDGTVPTLNLRLVPNDSLTGKEVEHEKFRSEEITCYAPGAKSNFGLFEHNQILENPVYTNIGVGTTFEVCNHTGMPIAAAGRVLQVISGAKPISSISLQQNILRKSLIQNLGYSTYEGFGSNNSVIDRYFSEPHFQVFPVTVDDGEPHYNIDVSGKIGRTLRYDILSPINLMIEDERGRRIGIDPDTGMIVNEIPGAWTSGSSGESGQPEFFLIPVSETGAVDHTIKTYATGEGEYHIVVQDIDTSSSSPAGDDPLGGVGQDIKPLIIAGAAQDGFGDDYEVVSLDGEQDLAYIDIGETTPTTLDIEKDLYTTLDDALDVRYSIRGNHDDVASIEISLFDENHTLISTTLQDITGVFEVALPAVGKYQLEVSLLDTSGQPIELPSAKKTLILERRSTTGEQENDTEVASILSPALHLQFPSFSLPVYIDAEKQLSHAFQVRTDFDYTEARLELQFPDGQTVSCERIAGFQYRSTGEVGTCRAKGFDIEVSYDSKVYTFDTEKKAIISLQEGENTYDIIYTPTGELLAVSNTLDNTIIFHSVGDQIESISDIYGNEVELRYTGFDESLQLERIVYPAGYQDVGEEALEDIVLDTKSSRFPLVYSGSTVNAEDQYIDYVRGADTKLYAIQGHEVYEVGELGRKKVFSASHDIQSLTVASSGNIYRYDGSLKKYQAYNGKIFDYKMNGGKWGSMAVNTDESYLYLVNPLAPGYSRFDLKRGVLRSVYTDEFLRAVGYFDDFLHMYSLPEIQTLEKNPEFSEKYGKVLPKIEERIHLLSPEKRESLKSQIKLEKQHILDKIANRYRKEKIRFLLSSIEEALSQVLAF